MESSSSSKYDGVDGIVAAAAAAAVKTPAAVVNPALAPRLLVRPTEGGT
jgi:hypothetical protein